MTSKVVRLNYDDQEIIIQALKYSQSNYEKYVEEFNNFDRLDELQQRIRDSYSRDIEQIKATIEKIR